MSFEFPAHIVRLEANANSGGFAHVQRAFYHVMTLLFVHMLSTSLCICTSILRGELARDLSFFVSALKW